MIAGRTRKAVATLWVGVLLVGCLGWSVWGIDAIVLTTNGQWIQGSVSGLAPAIRLAEPESITFVVPDAEYDIALADIRQITLDFPRVVIEAGDRVLIGPYSAFRGIDEVLRIDRDRDAVELPTPSIRAIALHGNALHAVPREWLGDGFLDRPEILAATPLAVVQAATSDTETFPILGQSEEPDLTPVWNGAAPAIPPTDTASEIPWWVGLLAVAALVVIIYFVTSGQGTS